MTDIAASLSRPVDAPIKPRGQGNPGRVGHPLRPLAALGSGAPFDAGIAANARSQGGPAPWPWWRFFGWGGMFHVCAFGGLWAVDPRPAAYPDRYAWRITSAISSVDSRTAHPAGRVHFESHASQARCIFARHARFGWLATRSDYTGPAVADGVFGHDLLPPISMRIASACPAREADRAISQMYERESSVMMPCSRTHLAAIDAARNRRTTGLLFVRSEESNMDTSTSRSAPNPRSVTDGVTICPECTWARLTARSNFPKLLILISPAPLPGGAGGPQLFAVHGY